MLAVSIASELRNLGALLYKIKSKWENQMKKGELKLWEEEKQEYT
jgi:hypothetical protein